MHVTLQLKVFVWCYAILWAFQIALLFNIALTYQLKSNLDVWINHSQEVQANIADLSKSFTLAESKGRYALFDEQSKIELPQFRQTALDSLNQLLQKVSDNPQQAEIALYLAKNIKLRFEIQDRMIATVQIVDGRLVSNPMLSLEGINAQNAVTQSLSDLEAEERRLMNIRYDNVFNNFWSIIKLFIGLCGLSIIASVANFVWAWRTLQHQRKIARDIRANSKEIVTNEELEFFAKYVEGQIAELPK